MKVLVGCEYSQTVTKAFRERGYEAFSCDILPTEGNPEWHLQMDVFEAIKIIKPDLAIFHPPCTYLSYAGIKHWNKPGRAEKRKLAMQFFMDLVHAPIKRICIENPVGYPNVAYREPDQIIHPYYFGEPYQKRTCLWLKNLPKLWYRQTIIPKPEPLYICQGEKCKGKKINWCEGIKGSGKKRSLERARFFKGVAEAMAEQWGNYKEIQSELLLFNMSEVKKP